MKITSSNLMRLAGLSAVVAGAIFAGIQPIHPADVVESVTTGAWAIITPLKTAMCLLFLVGITGLYARQVEQTGWLGLAGFLMLSLSWALMTAFVFGLVHGFGFAFALRESLQFAGSHVVSALLAFNVGIELGQVAALMVMLPLVALLLRVVPERAGVIVLSALAAHTAWHWMLERGEVWWKYPLPRPDAADLAELFGWAIAALVIGMVLASLGNRFMRPVAARDDG